jgi:exosortase/archaeosortase family protein
MLMLFCSLGTAVAVMLPCGWKTRVILIASTMPLALACNIVRITVAGVASAYLGSAQGHFIFHDVAGLLMLPLAFALLGGEVFLLGKLFRPARPDAPFVLPPPATGRQLHGGLA